MIMFFIHLWFALQIRLGYRSPCCGAKTRSDDMGYDQSYCTQCNRRVA